jgi:hypothetical protein
MPIIGDHDGYFSTKTEKKKRKKEKESVLTNLVTTSIMMDIDIICVLFKGLTLFIPGESCFKGF